ncbi:MAG: hypothetical protein ACO3C1_05935 [Ilumatobacteraceae bacterium]
MRRFPMRSRLGRLAVAVAVLTPSVAVASTVAGVPGVASAACTLCAGGEFHPIAPVRIFDTRPTSSANPELPINDVQPYGAKPINLGSATTGVQRFDVQLLGIGDRTFENPWLPSWVAPTDVLAVLASVIVVRPGTRGNLATWPAGTVRLTSSSLVNFASGQTTSNLSVVRPGTGGALTVEMRGAAVSTAHVVIDVFGWYSTSSYLGEDRVESTDERGGRTVPITPGRILDTGAGAVGPASTTELTIRGASTIGTSPRLVVPDSQAVTAVMLNVAVSLPTENTYVSVVPEMPLSGVPATSNANVAAGTVRSAMVIVPIAADGRIRLYNNAGYTRLVGDVLGYVETRLDELRAGRVVPLSTPFRAFDTRLTQFGKVPLGPGQSEEWSFAAFAASVTVASVSVGNQVGFFGTLTNASLTRQYPTVPVRSNLRLSPSTGVSTVPVSSHINTAEDVAVANMTVGLYGTSSRIWVYNAAGYAHYLLDVSAVILAD